MAALPAQKATRRASPSALPRRAEKHVRIGVVHRGKIIEEQLLPPGRGITVGSHPRSSLILPGDGGPPERLELFGNRGGQLHLKLSAGIRGKVDLGEGVVTLDRLRGRRTEWIELSPRARGKVQIGDFTLLFQLVDAPPAAVRPRQGLHWREVDWVFFALVVVSSLMHAAAVVWIQSQPPPTKSEVQKLVHEYVSFALPEPTPAPEPPPAMEPEPQAEVDPEAAEVPGPKAVDPEADPELDRKGASPPLAEVAPPPQVGEMGLLGLIAADKEDPEGAVASIIHDRSTLEDQAINDAVADARGVYTRKQPGGLRGPKESGEGAATNGNIEGIGCCVTPPRDIHEAVPRPPKAPTPPPEIITTPPTVTDGDFDIGPFLKALRPRFKSCYEKALKKAPDLAGRVSLGFITGATGSVTEAWIEDDSMESATVNACLLKELRRARLPSDAADLEVEGYGLMFAPQ